MDAVAIIQITSALLELSAKYIRIAKENEELSAEQELAYRKSVDLLFAQDYWKVEPDPS